MDGDTISGVVELPEDELVRCNQIANVQQTYAERLVLVLEEAYILPGLIDLSVRPNGLWQGTSAATRLAISGGVTLFLEEPNCLGLDSPIQHLLYCDVARAEVASSVPIEPRDQGAFAVKGYLSSPGKGGCGLEGSLKEAISGWTANKLLILDLFRPSFNLLSTNTPFRTCEVRERLSAPLPSMSDPAAFPDSQDETLSTQSSLDMSTEAHTGDKRLSLLIGQLQNEAWKRRKLTSDSETKLLSAMELAKYSTCGKTTYEKGRSSEFSAPRSEAKRSDLLSRRRTQLALEPVVTKREQHDDHSSNRLYVSYLANYPDFTELEGVRELTRALEACPHTQVHVTNISSVQALSALVQLKERHMKSLTLETAPHFLYFNAERIQDGNTLLKSVPPIRQEDNRDLLVEYLCVGAIDTVGSSHCGLSPEHKRLQAGDFKRAVSGVAGLGSSLQAVWTVIKNCSDADKRLVRLVRAMSSAPAAILGIQNRRGSIAAGCLADLVVFRPHEAATPIDSEMSPYKGERLMGRIETVYLRGRRAFHMEQACAFGRREQVG